MGSWQRRPAGTCLSPWGCCTRTQVQPLPAGQPDYDRSVTAEVEAEPAVMSLSAGEGWRAEDLVPAALSASVLYREVYPGVDSAIRPTAMT